MHGYDTWDWRDLTFRSVAERAGVGERTVYRHFPTERHLHDAVMERLESEAGVSYEDVDLGNSRGDGPLSGHCNGFRSGIPSTPRDPVRRRRPARRDALLRAVAASAPGWSETEQRVTAGLRRAVEPAHL